MNNKDFRIKWVGPNTACVTVKRNNTDLYFSKKELLTLLCEIEMFKNYYHVAFNDCTDNTDNITDYPEDAASAGQRK